MMTQDDILKWQHWHYCMKLMLSAVATPYIFYKHPLWKLSQSIAGAAG